MPETRQEKWWQEGLGLAMELTGWLIIPILGALILGKWLDNHYDSAPWLFLLCTAVAFIITCCGIIYKAAIWMREISTDQNKQKSNLEPKINDPNKRS